MAAPEPSPIPFFEAVNAYQLTEAMRAALSLDLFSAIAEAEDTPARLALRTQADPRGLRILCDFLTTFGYLEKSGDRYGLPISSATFLSRTSPAYLGDSIEFLLADELVAGFRDLTGCVRRGGTTVSARGTMEEQHQVWVKFAQVMGPIIANTAPALAQLGDPEADRPLRVLDLAAGHGLFGIAFARRNPHTHVTAQDWARVLEVAREHARKAQVADRYTLLPGDAFAVDLGSGYDVVLLTNFLHHFDVATCDRLLKRVAQCLKPGGVAITLEFIPDPDRVNPPPAARFALTMLASTAAGDAYTFNEYAAMFRDAGFSRSELHPLENSAQSAIVAER